MKGSSVARLALLAAGASFVAIALWMLFQEAPRAFRWPLRLLTMSVIALATVYVIRLLWIGARRLRPLFSDGRRTDPLLLGLFIALHLLLLGNAVFHHPMATYDSKPHREVAHLWSRLEVPTREQTRGIHYAPLGYAPTSLLLRWGVPEREALKVTQLVNVFYSAILVCGLLLFARLISPDDLLLRRLVLGALLCLPVYYKSFAMARPEPMLAMWCVLATYCATRIFCLGERRWSHFAWFGIFTGAMVLTRQWGAFLLPAFGVAFLLSCWWYPERWPRLLQGLVISVGLCLGIAGWYYALMTIMHGTLLAFNSVLRPFSFSNWEPGFFWDVFPPGLFIAPVKNMLENRFFALLHAEIWGDYWGMWLFDCIPGKLTSEGYFDTAASVVPYLRVSIPLALGGTLLLAVGVLGVFFTNLYSLSRTSAFSDRVATLPPLVVLFTVGFYFVFVVCYTNTSSIRATYILQIFPFAAFCLGYFLWRIRGRSSAAFWALLVAWFTVGLMQAPAFVTRIPSPREASVLLGHIPWEVFSAVALGLMIQLMNFSRCKFFQRKLFCSGRS
ncbi:MAG: hypothetical protein SNJ52_02625 [Verrucomicrobiia bacterium]